MNKKIIIVSVKAGAGHFKAAQALEEAAKARGFTVKNADLLDYTNGLMRFLFAGLYLKVVQIFPELWAFGYKHYKLVLPFIKSRPWLDKINFGRFLKLAEEFDPDVVIATHFTAAAVLATYRKTAKKNYKLAVVLTDYEYHPVWLVKDADMFFVATEKMKSQLASVGVPAGKISITGIPVGLKFSEQKDEGRLKQKYGLKPGVPTVLISAGSFGVTPLGEMVKKLKNVAADFELLVVCGRNEQLKKELSALQKSEPRLKHVFGFVDFMDELMAVSDLFVTKPGGISVSESLAAGLPMILIEPIPGQEEANAAYISENGAGAQARDLASLVYEFERLVKNPGKLPEMAERADAIAKPNAANDIIE